MAQPTPEDALKSVDEGAALYSDDDDRLLREIEGIFVFGEGRIVNKCYAAFELLEQFSDASRPKAVQATAEWIDNAESSKEIQVPVFINSNEQADLESRFGPVVDQLLDLILSDNHSVVDFYGELWNLVQNPIFHDRKAKAFAFYWVMIDKRLPYFQIGPGYRMTEEEWRAATKRVSKKLAKLRFILAKDFRQKSEEASLLLQELDEMTDLEERIRALSYLIFYLRRESEREVERYQKILKRRGLM
ncbi:hypothetical protein EUA04_17180 [Mycolicibacterium obuense]|uniref:Uncharacterized protein n=1 Tax=Mycolicibacterium obuense TaxID=1807 RepID=A0A4R5X442_9MYCO|nr:hypothetical protein [Mycolicibacterium obuense]TDL06452.1 hypothetical protein EUA04_17180 [Mycolicibacterium obuense]